MGNTCKPMAVLFQCMTKFTTNKKKKKKKEAALNPCVGKERANHSSILAWEILRAEEPGGLQSMGSQRVAHALATKPGILSAQSEVFPVRRGSPAGEFSVPESRCPRWQRLQGPAGPFSTPCAL